MDRRGFIRMSIAGAGVGIIAPQVALAGSSTPSMAGGVFYTKDAPGRWSKKAAGHLPQIEVEKGQNGVAVRVTTGHEMLDYQHYIVKHILLDQNFGFIDEHLFDPMSEKAPISKFALKEYSGPLYALSVCNKHDTWMSVAEV
ncbi:MAG: hypothetical protein MI754_16300 [Chromatiales bacterium]|nr:hypothetical protein [Chromatiales bacterium]